jgi:hypothetical protein
MLPGQTSIFETTTLIFTSIKILHTGVVRALELRDELLDGGLIQDLDFEWEYHQPKYDASGFEAVMPRHVVFRFQDPKLATYYQIKWAR